MNEKKAKELRRIARENGVQYKPMKKWYKGLRRALRQSAIDYLWYQARLEKTKQAKLRKEQDAKTSRASN